jgi:hypothetical protein
MSMDSKEKKAFAAAIAGIMVALGGLLTFLAQPDQPPVPPIVTDSTQDSTIVPPPVVVDSIITTLPPAQGTWANNAKIAELPRATVSTKYPSVTRSIKVSSNLQAAYDSAKGGDELRLQMGSVFTVNLLLHPKVGSGWIVIRADTSDAALTQARMTPSRAALLKLPRITTNNNNNATITAENQSHNVRFTGLEITTGGTDVNVIMNLGVAGEKLLSNLAHDFVIDRSYVHASTTTELRRCVALNAYAVAVVKSWISECHAKSGDSQALWGYNAPGPYLIEDNYLDSGHEVIMFGGADPAITNMIPADIMIRLNDITQTRLQQWCVADEESRGTQKCVASSNRDERHP